MAKLSPDFGDGLFDRFSREHHSTGIRNLATLYPWKLFAFHFNIPQRFPSVNVIQLWMDFSLRYQGRQLGCIVHPFQVKVRYTQTFCKILIYHTRTFQLRLARILEWIEGGIQTVEGETLYNLVNTHYLLIIDPPTTSWENAKLEAIFLLWVMGYFLSKCGFWSPHQTPLCCSND